MSIYEYKTHFNLSKPVGLYSAQKWLQSNHSAMTRILRRDIADTNAANDRARAQADKNLDSTLTRYQNHDATWDDVLDARSAKEDADQNLDIDPSSILDISWDMENCDRGSITLLTSSPLSRSQQKAVSEWIRGQNSDGLGEGFEQLFAHMDWKRNKYTFRGGATILTDQTPTQAYRADISTADGAIGATITDALPAIEGHLSDALSEALGISPTELNVTISDLNVATISVMVLADKELSPEQHRLADECLNDLIDNGPLKATTDSILLVHSRTPKWDLPHHHFQSLGAEYPLYHKLDGETLHLSSSREDESWKRGTYLPDRTAITKVVIDDPIQLPPDSSHLFAGMAHLTAIDGLENLDTSQVTSMYCMFADCYAMDELHGLENWDVSNVTDMAAMFANCAAPTIDLSHWTPLSVTLTNSMFLYGPKNVYASANQLASQAKKDDCLATTNAPTVGSELPSVSSLEGPSKNAHSQER